MTTSVRAKFHVSKTETTQSGDEKLYKVTLTPVTNSSSENAAFYKWTPGGSIELGTINEQAARFFSEFGDVYVDFTRAQ